MKRRFAFWLLMITASLALAALGIELVVRVVIDDGMQFDLEMWKYARDLKQTANNALVGHEHRPNSVARLMGVDVMHADQQLAKPGLALIVGQHLDVAPTQFCRRRLFER